MSLLLQEGLLKEGVSVSDETVMVQAGTQSGHVELQAISWTGNETVADKTALRIEHLTATGLLGDGNMEETLRRVRVGMGLP